MVDSQTYANERDVYVDPVSHEPVQPGQEAGRSFYCGHMYFFRDRFNKETFDEDPMLWIPTPHASQTSADLSPVEDE